MAALPLPKYGLDKLYLFPYYQSRAQYKQATGTEAPAFDATRPPQAWCDPEAAKSTKRSVVYDNVLAVNAKGQPLADDNGKPYLEPMMMLKSEASTVNIPLKQGSNEPGTEMSEAPPPLRALDADEELSFDFGGVVVVRNRKFADTSVTNGFTEQDHQLLLAVARKLNINV